IPLTLAIIPALIVTCAGDRYAVPQASLLELVRLEGEQARRGVEHVHGGSVYRLRDKLLPLVYLDRQLQADGAGPGRRPDVQIVVLQAGDRQFGLVVDGTQDTEEIVVKPLGRHLKSVPLFAGATILGDGQVVLILDVLGLARGAGVVADANGRILAERALQARQRGPARQVLLLSADGRRLAVPLELVARLEELPAAAAERAG